MDAEALQAFLTDLQTQLGCYRDMVDLNKQQQELLESDARNDTDRLLALVAQKQALMGELGRIDDRLRPAKDEWHNVRANLPDNVQSFADGLLAELASIIQTLIQMEDEAHKQLEAIMQTAQGGLQRIQQKAQINRAYAAYAGHRTEARFVDKKSGE